MPVSIISAKQAADLIPDGASVMFGGFMNCGGPKTLVNALIEAGKKDLTLICNDTGLPGVGVAKLIENRMVRSLKATHVGLNPETGRQINASELEFELIPQGTFVERIRAGGAGLGGFLTPSGVGTTVADGKQVLNLSGRDYLLELPLKADFAILRGHLADKAGNIHYRLATRNFNVAMATAAETVIAEVENIVEIGQLDPDMVMTPGIFVDFLVQA
ncbi:MAG: CoA transferase subunit A [Deltaproteobacteria bacterium]|jgi:acetate CoA/acetoacetate CoA-transferase alpha subunit|nr:CoA transferase subunit A [Deltaproteobacteria bacterium]